MLADGSFSGHSGNQSWSGYLGCSASLGDLVRGLGDLGRMARVLISLVPTHAALWNVLQSAAARRIWVSPTGECAGSWGSRPRIWVE